MLDPNKMAIENADYYRENLFCGVDERLESIERKFIVHNEYFVVSYAFMINFDHPQNLRFDRRDFRLKSTAKYDSRLRCTWSIYRYQGTYSIRNHRFIEKKT